MKEFSLLYSFRFGGLPQIEQNFADDETSFLQWLHVMNSDSTSGFSTFSISPRVVFCN